MTEQWQAPLEAGGYACFHIVARGETLTSIAARYRKYGGATVGEQVFPVMSHLLARAGIVPAPKFRRSIFPSAFQWRRLKNR